ncbi:MAG: GDYXXLXY domain-containing protein [Methanosarcinaceae archaeon]|nr:GDYXXLXY domain-containing protein [Methanosarcinaceae archaeon]
MDRKQFLLLMLVPAFVILVFFDFKLFTASMGEEILLKTAPVDPRDLFRGDYVRLSYEISMIDLNNVSYDRDFSIGDTIYATLSKKEKFWTVDSVGHFSSHLAETQVCMRGSVTASSQIDNRVWVEWGIESYFVPEGEGREIEREKCGEYIYDCLCGFYRLFNFKGVSDR